MYGLHWNVVNPLAHSKKLTPDFLSAIIYQSLGWNFVPMFTLHAEILYGLSLHTSCTCYLKFCGIICIAFLQYTKTIFLSPSTTSGSYNFSAPKSISMRWEEGCDIGILFRAEHLLESLILCTKQ